MAERLETVSYKTGRVRTESVGMGKSIIDATGCHCPLCGCHEVWAWEQQAEIIDVDLVNGVEWDYVTYWDVVDTSYSCVRCEHSYTYSELVAQAFTNYSYEKEMTHA